MNVLLKLSKEMDSRLSVWAGGQKKRSASTNITLVLFTNLTREQSKVKYTRIF